MDRKPTAAWIITFIVAAALKVLGILVAMTTAQLTSGTWGFDRWAMGLATGLLLLILLFPWYRRFNSLRAVHVQVILALSFAIASQYVDVIYSSHVAFDPLAQNDRFNLVLGWSLDQINNVHALGILFTMVPIVLASWHYGVWGMLASLGLNGLLYMSLPLFVPADAFNWWFYAVRGFVLLGTTLILAFVVGTLASQQRKREQQLAAANAKLAEQAAVMEQLATSRERNRLARELHDTLAHSLSGTAVQLQAVKTLMKVDVAAASAELTTAQNQIKSGLAEARRSIAALRASPLEELGLANALHERATALAERAGITINCTIDPLPPLPPLTEQTIYRIADEALVNAEKHAQADKIALRLGKENGEKGKENIILTVTDNGIGFDTATPTPSGHFGLIGMTERAMLVNATLTITSELQSGTTITLTIPHHAIRNTQYTLQL